MPIDIDLIRCFRYFQTYTSGGVYKFAARGYVPNANSIFSSLLLPVVMRATPTGTKVGTWTVGDNAQPSIFDVTTKTLTINSERTGAGTGDAYFWAADGAGVTLSAEL
jgi:hypothetical protein